MLSIKSFFGAGGPCKSGPLSFPGENLKFVQSFCGRPGGVRLFDENVGNRRFPFVFIVLRPAFSSNIASQGALFAPNLVPVVAGAVIGSPHGPQLPVSPDGMGMRGHAGRENRADDSPVGSGEYIYEIKGTCSSPYLSIPVYATNIANVFLFSNLCVEKFIRLFRCSESRA